MNPPTIGEVIDYLALREYPPPLLSAFSVNPDGGLTMHLNACCVMRSRDLDLAQPIDPQVDALVSETLDIFVRSHAVQAIVISAGQAQEFLAGLLGTGKESPVGPEGARSLMAAQDNLEATIRRLKGGGN